MLRWGRRNYFSQLRIKWNIDINWIAVFIFGLTKLNSAITDVLGT